MLFLLITLSSIGLPLMNGFVGEFLVLSGTFRYMPSWGILAATGVIWSACYMLWMYQRVFYGTVKNPVNSSLPDLDLRERGAVWPLAILALVMGVASSYWIKPMDPSVAATINGAPAKPVATGNRSLSTKIVPTTTRSTSTGAGQ